MDIIIDLILILMVLGVVGIATFGTILSTKKLIFHAILWAIFMLISYLLTIYLWLYFFIIQIIIVIALFIPNFIGKIKNNSFAKYDLMFWYTLGVVALTMTALLLK